MNFIKKPIRYIIKFIFQEIHKREYQSQRFLRRNERPIEYRFVFDKLIKICPTTVLDVGTGTTSLPALMRHCGYLVTAIDNVSDYWPRGMVNKHYFIIDDDITKTKLSTKYDFITCISVLEHIKDYPCAVQSMLGLLNPVGFLVLTFPYNEQQYIENVYALPGAGYGQDSPYICQVFSRREIDGWLNRYNAKLVEQEYWQFFSGDFWTFGEYLKPPLQVKKSGRHQLTCLLLQKD